VAKNESREMLLINAEGDKESSSQKKDQNHKMGKQKRNLDGLREE